MLQPLLELVQASLVELQVEETVELEVEQTASVLVPREMAREMVPGTVMLGKALALAQQEMAQRRSSIKPCPAERKNLGQVWQLPGLLALKAQKSRH